MAFIVYREVHSTDASYICDLLHFVISRVSSDLIDLVVNKANFIGVDAIVWSGFHIRSIRIRDNWKWMRLQYSFYYHAEQIYTDDANWMVWMIWMVSPITQRKPQSYICFVLSSWREASPFRAMKCIIQRKCVTARHTFSWSIESR